MQQRLRRDKMKYFMLGLPSTVRNICICICVYFAIITGHPVLAFFLAFFGFCGFNIETNDEDI